MGETSKRRAVRESTGWFTKYLKGAGIDIGCGDDPVTPDCVRWDKEQGDAQLMAGVADSSYDWVYSSHCLEHIQDPSEALRNWWRILKPKGYLIVSVPDEDLYEQGMWPPHINTDHKTSWTLHKTESWSPVCRSLVNELGQLPKARILRAEVMDEGYNYDLYQAVDAHIIVSRELAEKINVDKTLTPEMLTAPLKCLKFLMVDQSGAPLNAQVSVEAVVQKLG